MIDFGIGSAKATALKNKMAQFSIFESDIAESFIHSGGKGGQNVNKVATCVRLKHRSSGIEIKCQKTRHQLLNRYYARVLLVEKIEADVMGEKSAAQQKIEKIRRQKRKRSKRAKDKMLIDKRACRGEKAKPKVGTNGTLIGNFT